MQHVIDPCECGLPRQRPLQRPSTDRQLLYEIPLSGGARPATATTLRTPQHNPQQPTASTCQSIRPNSNLLLFVPVIFVLLRIQLSGPVNRDKVYLAMLTLGLRHPVDTVCQASQKNRRPHQRLACLRSSAIPTA